MKTIRAGPLVSAFILLVANSAIAADAANGGRLAERWCSACHVVTNTQRQANADASPFEEIAKRPAFRTAIRRPFLPVDRTTLGTRHWAPGLDVIGRRHPYVQDAVHRCEPRDPVAIRRDFRPEEGRIVEQRTAGDEWFRGARHTSTLWQLDARWYRRTNRASNGSEVCFWPAAEVSVAVWHFRRRHHA